MIRCHDEILEQVRRSTGLSVTDVQVERVLNGLSCSINEEAKQIILQYGTAYTEKVLSAIMESGFDLRAMPSVFIGGGSGILQKNMVSKEKLCKMTVLPDVNLNAAGYERIAEQMQHR